MREREDSEQEGGGVSVMETRPLKETLLWKVWAPKLRG